MVKVFLVEDEFVVREGIKNNINWAANGYDFCGEASDGEVAYSMIQKVQPDILITDIKMPFMDGLTLSRMVKAEFPWIEIILLTGYEDFQYAKEAIRIGVSSYLSKPISGNDLLKEVGAISEKVEEKKAEREATKRYEEEMKERNELDKQAFFGKLINSNYGAFEYIEMAKKLSIDITALKYNILLIKVWSKKHEIGEYSNSVLKIEEGIRTIAVSNGAICFNLDLEGLALLFKGDDDNTISRNIEIAIQEMVELFKEYDSIRYFAGIGQSVNRITEISTSFSWASRAYAHMYLTSDNGFMVGSEEELKNSKEDVILSEIDPKHIDRKLVKEFLRRGEISETEFFLEEFFNGMGKNAIRSTMLRQYISMDLYFCVTDFVLNELGLSREELDDRISAPSADVLGDEKKTFDYMKKIMNKALLIKQDNAIGKYHDIMNDAVSYIEQHYAEEELSLNSLAAHVNFSPNHLSAVFKQETGQPFIKYLTDYRMEQAKDLLCTTSKRSNEIGALVGYKDPHYFSYLFKKTQGLTPTQYRNGLRKEE
ncbi:response regulator transcription factor [Butyrivibrio sp.]|uniref:response regulator transcription factor n=1 Tax=Butyrivibrio sp. TaxID=28121 RepID=UPI0025C543D4|nr:response regulator [Butyrivibrio sp.]